MLDGLDRLLDQERFSGERDIGGKKDLCDAFGGVLDRFKHNCLKVTGEDDHMVVKSDLHDLANAYADHIGKDPEWNAQRGFTTGLTEAPEIDGGQSRKITGEKERVFIGVLPEKYAVDELDVDVRYHDGRDEGSQATL